MKLWFQQNRALATLLIAFGICALFAGLVLYWRWTTWSNARQTFDQAAAEKSRLDRLDPFPNDANYRKLQGYLDRYNTALNKFKDELKKEIVPAPPLAPNEFQSRLRQATVATLNRAQTNSVKLPDKFQLGFDEFAMALPETAAAPLLGQELSQIQMLINILLDAKVDSVNSSGQFFIVRTLHVHNEKDKGPSRQRTGEPAPAEPAAQPGAAVPLNFIVGNEHIEVSATIEMVRF